MTAVPQRRAVRRFASRKAVPLFHVLVIDADPDYRSVIAHVVELAGGGAETVGDFSEGRKVVGTRVDLVIIGLGVSDIVQLDAIKELRVVVPCPVIMLHESFEEARSIYEAGVDQILPKPFVPGALVGAIKAGLRGPSPTSVLSAATSVQIGGVIFDSELREVRHGERKAAFSRREWELLTFFLANTNRYYEGKVLLAQVWEGSVSGEQFRTYVGRIRHKLAPLAVPLELLTRPGVGYCMAFEQSGTA